MASKNLWDRLRSLPNLVNAWRQEAAKRSAPGIDRVDVETFEDNWENNIQAIIAELDARTYQPMPVTRFTQRTGPDKERALGICTLRDRIVQRALLHVLSPLYEPLFAEFSYAYRPKRAACHAAERMEEYILAGRTWIGRTDIASFFDTIDHDRLMEKLAVRVKEEEILWLIRRFLKNRLFDACGFIDPILGIVQGSTLSPFLSNVFLNDVDHQVLDLGIIGVRYSDDIAIVADSEQTITAQLQTLRGLIEAEGLTLREEKTLVAHINSTFNFLGYVFDPAGRGPAVKAVDSLRWRLTDGLTTARTNLDEHLKEKVTAIRGWFNYYETLRAVPINSLTDLLATMMVADDLNRPEEILALCVKRPSLDDPDTTVMTLLAQFLSDRGQPWHAQLEWWRILALDPSQANAREQLQILGMLPADALDSIAPLMRAIAEAPAARQAYVTAISKLSESGFFSLAKFIEARVPPEPLAASVTQQPAEIVGQDFAEKISKESIERLLEFFTGREDAFALEHTDPQGRRIFRRENGRIRRSHIIRHLSGKQTLGCYQMRVDDSVQFLAIDIDVPRRLLTTTHDAHQREQLIALAHQDAIKVRNAAQSLNCASIIEDSGSRGRHVLLLFAQAIPARSARRLAAIIMDEAGPPEGGIEREVFPKQDQLQPGAFGCQLKLPWGIHAGTRRRSLFLADDGSAPAEQETLFLSLPTVSRDHVSAVLKAKGAATGMWQPATKRDDSGRPARPVPAKGAMAPIDRVMNGCKMLAYLRDKARDTGYLTHQERLAFLLVFGHLGEEGFNFIHTVMGHCVNYNEAITSRWINRRYGSPVSCPRMREHHREIAGSVSCDCRFPEPNRPYPSPLLHAGPFTVAPDVGRGRYGQRGGPPRRRDDNRRSGQQPDQRRTSRPPQRSEDDLPQEELSRTSAAPEPTPVDDTPASAAEPTRVPAPPAAARPEPAPPAMLTASAAPPAVILPVDQPWPPVAIPNGLCPAEQLNLLLRALLDTRRMAHRYDTRLREIQTLLGGVLDGLKADEAASEFGLLRRTRDGETWRWELSFD